MQIQRSFTDTLKMTQILKYIIVGQLERITYANGNLAKFETYNGQLWDEVYRDGSTVIYQVK